KVALHLRKHGLSIKQLSRDQNSTIEVAQVEAVVSEGSRKILEATGEREFLASYKKEERKLPAGTYIVSTEQPLGAIAVYMCEARSDDGVVSCGIIPAPAPATEFPIWRVIDPI